MVYSTFFTNGPVKMVFDLVMVRGTCFDYYSNYTLATVDSIESIFTQTVSKHRAVSIIAAVIGTCGKHNGEIKEDIVLHCNIQ